MAEWLQAMNQPLAIIIESTKRPRRFDPLLSDSNPPLLMNAAMPMVQSHRDAARALTARAMLHLNTGTIPEAWQDLLACHRLSRLTGQGRTIIEMLVADAIENMACVADQALLAHGNLTADQARQMANDLQKLPPLPHMADAVDLGERYIFLDCAGLGRSWIGKDRAHDQLAGRPWRWRVEHSHAGLVRIERNYDPLRCRRASRQAVVRSTRSRPATTHVDAESIRIGGI